jgi:broad specificity phosphatase PhoE
VSDFRKLILIKHSKPLVEPRVASHLWKLSDEGRQRCDALATAVRPHAPAIVVSSEEDKAAETARILAEKLAVPVETAPGLHEHDRSDVPHMDSREFISYVALFFKQPAKLVLGLETARRALERFSAALDAVLKSHTEGNIAVVTHGTVLSLFVASKTAEDGFLLWRRMGLPSMVILDLPQWQVIERVERV